MTHDPFSTYHGDDFQFRREYKLRTRRMRFDTAPVGWNARASVWHGTDWREPIRNTLHRLKFVPYAWTDDRARTYDARTQRIRKMLGTHHDVEARKASSYASRWLRDRSIARVSRQLADQ